MKLPTEAELIEVENFMGRWKPDDGPVKFADEALYRHHRVWNTLKTLIALARDPSALLQDIPLDDALDRAMAIDTDTPPVGSCQPPHRTAPKLSVVVQPKKTGKTAPYKKHKR